MALAITGNVQDAQDALQDAVVSAFLARDQLRDHRYFKPWIKTIVAHQCGRVIRQRRKIVPMGRPEEFLAQRCHYGFEDDLIWELVERLPQNYAQVLTLRYAADLKQAEIAQVLGIPVGTVKSRLHNAMAKMRELMERGCEGNEVSRR